MPDASRSWTDQGMQRTPHGHRKLGHYSKSEVCNGCVFLSSFSSFSSKGCVFFIFLSPRESLNIPVISNGNIRTMEDVDKCLAYTKCDGVMSGDTMLWNPALFSGKTISSIQLAREYVEMSQKYPIPKVVKNIRAHFFKILGTLYVGTDCI
jgi:hypothetical protein